MSDTIPLHGAPTGTTITCRGWVQEAALRMLLNNLDPAVGENPAELVVYGGNGKAARNPQCLKVIIDTLRRLGDEMVRLRHDAIFDFKTRVGKLVGLLLKLAAHASQRMKRDDERRAELLFQLGGD